MTDYQKVARPRMDTGILGQVDPPTEEELARMQQSPYVWRAADGALRRVAAERALLPADPTAHPQNVHLFKGADAAIYVRQNQILCKSIDGGRSWGPLSALRVPLGNGSWRPANPEDVTHLRWRVGDTLMQGETRRVTFRAIVR